MLVGDPRQLPEIEAGGLFTRLTQNPRTLHLTDNRRQHETWERDALTRLRAGNIDPAIHAYSTHGRIHQSEDPEALRAVLVSDYLDARTNTSNPYDVAILAVSRADVAHLNALVRAALIAQGELGATPLHLRADDTGDLVAGDDSLEMRTGDLVIIGRNDNRLGLYNGTRAVVTAVDTKTHSLTLRTDDDRDVTVTATWAACHDLSHAYAMTLHKAQGLTVDHALLYGSQALTREAGYVGLSRGRRENHIYISATTRMSGRTGECDFDRPDPLADEQQPTADLARRLHASRTDQLASLQQPGSWAQPDDNRSSIQPVRTRQSAANAAVVHNHHDDWSAPQEVQGQRLLLTVPKAAHQLGIGRSLLYELLADGQVESLHVGRLRRIRDRSSCELGNNIKHDDREESDP